MGRIARHIGGDTASELVARTVSWARRRLGPTGSKGVVSVFDRLVVAGTNFLTLVIVGRAAGVEQLGVFALAWTAMLAITALQEAFVHSPYTVHLGASSDAPARARYSGAALGLQAATSALAMAVASFVALVLALSGHAAFAAALALMVAIPAASLREFVRRFLFARMEAMAVIALDIAFSALQLSGLLLLVALDRVTPAGALLVMAGAAALPAACWFATRGRATGFFARPATGEIAGAARRHLRFGRWLGASQMADLAVTHGATWLLAFLSGTAATGIFAACNSVVLVVNPLILGLGSILLPRAARARHESGNAEVGRIVWKVTGVLAISVGLVTLVVMLAGEWAVQQLYALAPAPAVGLTVLLLATANLISATSFAIDNGFMVVGRQGVNFVASVIGLVGTIVAALLLVPSFGVVGMATGVLIGTVATTLFQFVAFSALVAPPPGRLALPLAWCGRAFARTAP